MASTRAVGTVYMAARTCLRQSSVRTLHSSNRRNAITTMKMPAMSPTMSEGGVSSWKKKEGESFAAGDVLLEIETDKATIDVEAQDDGVMGKIIVGDGSKNIKVGRLIAFLAEEGDDISNLEIPKEEDSKPEATAASEPAPPPPPSEAKPSESASTPKPGHAIHPTHSKPLFPSVYRLLAEHGIENAEKIKGTGIRGMLTKGDVLAHLGLASSPKGTLKEEAKVEKLFKPEEKKEEPPKQPLDGPAIRRSIVSSMLNASLKARNPRPSFADADFDSVIADYLPPPASAPKIVTDVPPVAKPPKAEQYLDGLI